MTRFGTFEPFLAGLRPCIGFHCFWFHCQDFGQFHWWLPYKTNYQLLNRSELKLIIATSLCKEWGQFLWKHLWHNGYSLWHCGSFSGFNPAHLDVTHWGLFWKCCCYRGVSWVMGGALWPEGHLALEALASKTEIRTTCPAYWGQEDRTDAQTGSILE